MTYKRVKAFDDIDDLSLTSGKLANPGPFSGEIDFFSLGSEAGSEQTVFDTAAEYRRVIGQLSGIRVYRDGFGIHVAKDWLDLGRQWTKGGSYYGLKPHNTLGYIAISARNNQQLEETTDREGFRNNAYYRNFGALLGEFVEFSGEAQALLRRGWLDYKKEKRRQLADVTPDTQPESISTGITGSLDRAASYRTALTSVSRKLRQSVDTGIAELNSMRSAGIGNGFGDRLHQAFAEVRNLVVEAATIADKIEAYLDELEKLKGKSAVLTDQIGGLKEQVQRVHEVIALGLTAEALSHEIDNISGQLAQRNQQVSRYLRANKINDTRISAFTEYVNTAVAALRRQLQFLAPSLQYVREKREFIDVEEFTTELLKHYTFHFATMPIGLRSDVPRNQHFKLEMNKGKLIQVLDNLFLNSEYWLKEEIRLGRMTRGTITIQVNKPYLRIWDDGRGVDLSVEETLFEPFVSTKGAGRGRGLGLYIVQQLLDAEGCGVRLLPERNSHGRRFKFEIDLTGAIVGKH